MFRNLIKYFLFKPINRPSQDNLKRTQSNDDFFKIHWPWIV